MFLLSMIASARDVEDVLRGGNPALISQLIPSMLADYCTVTGKKVPAFPAHKKHRRHARRGRFA